MYRKISADLTLALLAGGIAILPFATATASDGYLVLHSSCKKAGCPDGTDSAADHDAMPCRHTSVARVSFPSLACCDSAARSKGPACLPSSAT